MSVDRVATSAQTAFFLSQLQNAGSALDKTQEQIASGKNANTYAGFGDKTQVLTATIAANKGAYHIYDLGEAQGLTFANEAVPGLLAPFLERPTAKPKSTVDHSDSPLTVAAEPENDVPNSSHFNV